MLPLFLRFVSSARKHSSYDPSENTVFLFELRRTWWVHTISSRQAIETVNSHILHYSNLMNFRWLPPHRMCVCVLCRCFFFVFRFFFSCSFVSFAFRQFGCAEYILLLVVDCLCAQCSPCAHIIVRQWFLSTLSCNWHLFFFVVFCCFCPSVSTCTGRLFFSFALIVIEYQFNWTEANETNTEKSV